MPKQPVTDIDSLLAKSRPVNIWQYWLLPVWSAVTHPFSVDKWLVQMTYTVETKADGLPTERTKFQRYVIALGDRNA